MSSQSKRALLIFNPVAGHYKPQRLHRFASVLQEQGWKITLFPTSYRGHGFLIAQEVLAHHEADLIIAGGGDGTISEIARALIGTSIPLALFPIGSANVLAREMAIPFNDRKNALMIDHVFSHTKAKTIWPGLIEAPEGKTIFIQMLGIGPDGWIVRHVSTRLKKYIGRTAYVISALKCLLSYKFTPFTLILDGKAEKATAAIITKGRYYGGKFQIIPSSPQELRSFEVILFQCQTMDSFLVSVLTLVLLRKKNKLMTIKTIEHATIPPHQELDLQIDGDLHKVSEADISISSRPLKIIAP